jgi:hypothetical protein
MDVYDETPVPLPQDLAQRIETEHAAATIAVKLLLATIALVLFDANDDAHTANHVHAFLTLDEERRAGLLDGAGAVALRLENNGDRAERERAAVARPGLDFFRFEWPLYAYSRRRDQIVANAATLLTAVAPGWSTREWLAMPPEPTAPMSLESLRAWLENPGTSRIPRRAPTAPDQRPPGRRTFWDASLVAANKLLRAIREHLR